MNDRQPVITQISSISSLGTGFDALGEGLLQQPALETVQSFEFHELDRAVPCFRTRECNLEAILGKKGLRTKDLSTKLLLATMELGFKDRFEADAEDEKPGIVVGTAFGSIQSIGDFLSDSIVNGVNAVNPMAFANTVINAPTGNANIRYGVRTLSATVATGFNAGIDALIYSCDYIRSGHIDAIVAGGLEEISYYALMGMARSNALSPSGALRPFARDADGVVMGEGCALFLLETAQRARARGAVPCAEIAGYCSAFDPWNGTIGFNPAGEGARYCIEQALCAAGINAAAIDVVVSGANGMPSGDAMEAEVIASLFGATPVAAYKAKTGECYGASGSLSLACAISDMKNSRISGVGSRYDLCRDINLVAETMHNRQSEYALLVSFSGEGHCAALVLKNPEPYTTTI